MSLNIIIINYINYNKTLRSEITIGQYMRLSQSIKVLGRWRPWDVTCRLKSLCLNESAWSEMVLHDKKLIRGRLGCNWLLTFWHLVLRSLITRRLAWITWLNDTRIWIWRRSREQRKLQVWSAQAVAGSVSDAVWHWIKTAASSETEGKKE